VNPHTLRVYATVIASGRINVLEDDEEKRRLEAGQQYRPITDQELKRTSVYAIVIENWSGRRNWPDEAEQSDEWPRLK
jgi:uncharacterized protein